MSKQFRIVKNVVFYNFLQWKNTRIISAFILAFILCFLLTEKTVTFAETHNTTMQIAETFIWTFGDSNSILLSSLLLLIIFADMPFITTATPFFLIRGSRRTWMLGQAVYICIATFLYLTFILVSSIVLCMGKSYVGNIWSRTAAILAYSKEGKRIALPATVKILEMSRPYQTMLWIFGLMLLYALVMVFIQMFFHIWKGQLAGVCAVLMFNSYGILLNPENIQKIMKLPEELYYKVRVLLGWISPLNHATYTMHDFGYDRLPTLLQTVILFVLSGAGLAVLICMRMKYYNFEFKGTAGR